MLSTKAKASLSIVFLLTAFAVISIKYTAQLFTKLNPASEVSEVSDLLPSNPNQTEPRPSPSGTPSGSATIPPW